MNWELIAAMLALGFGGMILGFMFAVLWEDVQENDWDE